MNTDKLIARLKFERDQLRADAAIAKSSIERIEAGIESLNEVLKTCQNDLTKTSLRLVEIAEELEKMEGK